MRGGGSGLCKEVVLWCFDEGFLLHSILYFDLEEFLKNVQVQQCISVDVKQILGSYLRVSINGEIKM